MGQEGTHALRQTLPLFNDLVGVQERVRPHGEPECLRGLEIDGRLEFGRCWYREVGWLFTFENAIAVGGRFAYDLLLVRVIIASFA
jgi:hypothetical protein